jgi:hypothetical protein
MSNRRKIKAKKGRPLTVAIVGKGEGRGLAPRRKTKGVEVWATNNAGMQQYCDMVFDMHNFDWTEEENLANYSHLIGIIPQEEIEKRAAQRFKAFKVMRNWMRENDKAIMSVKKYTDLNKSYVYPLEAIIKKFDCDLFTSVVPYMIAYAIFKKFKKIDLYGINCASNEEWRDQRDAVTGWLMFAKGKGIKVTVNGGAKRPLRAHDHKLYGYDIPQRHRGIETVDGWWEPKDRFMMNPTKEDLVERRFKVWKEA